MERIVDLAIEYGIIPKEQKDLYIVAVTSLFFSIVTWGTLIVIGSIFRVVYPCIIFLLFHIPLRIYAGGYHQPTRIRCYIQSLFIFILMMLGFASQISQWIFDNWIIVIPFSVVVFLFAPVAALNKPLTYKEYQHHKALSRIILVIQICVIVCFRFFELNDYLYFSVFSVIIVSLQVVLGFVIKAKQRKKDNDYIVD